MRKGRGGNIGAWLRDACSLYNRQKYLSEAVALEVKLDRSKTEPLNLENAAISLAGVSLVLSLFSPMQARAHEAGAQTAPPTMLDVRAAGAPGSSALGEAGIGAYSDRTASLIDVSLIRRNIPVSIHWLGVNIPGAKLDLFHSEFNGQVGLRLKVHALISQASNKDYIYPATIIPEGEVTKVIFGEGSNQVEAWILPKSEVRMNYYPSNKTSKMVRAVVTIRDDLVSGEREQKITFLGAPGQQLRTTVQINKTSKSNVGGIETTEVTGPVSVTRTDISRLASSGAGGNTE